MDNLEILDKVGSNIRKIRLKSGLSQESVAMLSEMNRSSFAAIDRGGVNLTILTMVKIARALDIKISEILEGVV